MTDDLDDRAARDPAPAVTRGIRLLELLADAGRPLTLTEIAGGLGLAKSSTANLCLALEAARMIERGAQGYRLGLRTAELGGAFAAQFNQVREFYGVCDASPVLAAELVQVAILDGADALYIARHEGSRAVRIGTPLGSRLPAALSATGRAMLSTLSDAEVTALVGADAASSSAADPAVELSGCCGASRTCASAAGRWMPRNRGPASSGAVPLEGWAPGDPQLAIGVGLPAGEADERRIAEVAAALNDAARQLTNPFSAAARRE
jgi:DNA-binding IclR family transcriptional regulator